MTVYADVMTETYQHTTASNLIRETSSNPLNGIYFISGLQYIVDINKISYLTVSVLQTLLYVHLILLINTKYNQ